MSVEPFIWKVHLVAAKLELVNSIHQNVFKSIFGGWKQILTLEVPVCYRNMTIIK